MLRTHRNLHHRLLAKFPSLRIGTATSRRDPTSCLSTHTFFLAAEPPTTDDARDERVKHKHHHRITAFVRKEPTNDHFSKSQQSLA
eukprot:scaffold3240_cov197-Alexandrium_tamarense.AAC.5